MTNTIEDRLQLLKYAYAVETDKSAKVFHKLFIDEYENHLFKVKDIYPKKTMLTIVNERVDLLKLLKFKTKDTNAIKLYANLLYEYEKILIPKYKDNFKNKRNSSMLKSYKEASTSFGIEV